MKIVLDTNVLMPALFTPGLCESLLDLVLGTVGCELVLSEHILAECRTHSAKKFHVAEPDVAAALSMIRKVAEIVEPAVMPRESCSDEDDLDVLGTAVAARADVLVTGDKHLLGLRNIRGIPILSPRELFERLG